MKETTSNFLLILAALIVGTGVGVDICFHIIDYPEKWMIAYIMCSSVISIILTMISAWLKSTSAKNVAKKS